MNSTVSKQYNNTLYETFVYVCVLLSERANQSIQQLSSALEQLHADSEEVEEVRGSDGNLFTTLAEEDKAAWSQKTQSEAGDLLNRCGTTLSLRHFRTLLGNFPNHNLV